MSKITDLSPDPRNANKGTERGLDMLKTSLREYGAGRSLLLDKHGVVIAGNKTLEAAASIGIERVRVVETDGTEIIAVKRIDLDLAEDARAKALAVADNRVSEVGLAWDFDIISELSADDIDLSSLFSYEELARHTQAEPEAPTEFPEYSENIKTDHRCPKCGYTWSGKSRNDDN